MYLNLVPLVGSLLHLSSRLICLSLASLSSWLCCNPCAVAEGREALGPLQTLDHIASDRHVGLLNVAQQGLQSKKLLCKPLLLLIEQPHMSVRISQKQCGPIDVP